MATNFEYYKDEILEISSAKYSPAKVNDKLVKCDDINCCECEFYSDEDSCGVSFINWLYAEHIEQPKLTKRERAFCEAVQTGWIAGTHDCRIWISVDKRLPEESLNSVLGWDEYRERCVFVQYYRGEWILGDHESVKVTHWMPIPEPPKGEDHV